MVWVIAHEIAATTHTHTHTHTDMQGSMMARLVKNLRAVQETQIGSLGGTMPWRRKWQPTPVFLPGESRG